MKRYLLLYIFSCFFFVQLTAQSADSVRNSFVRAEALYKTGDIDQACRILEENLPSFRGTMRTEACRLTALCLLALDRFAEAEQYVSLLLKDEPYYYISLQDPERFADMVRKHRETKVTLVTASQQVETPEEAPVPVTLITEEMIRAIHARCLRDVLIAYVPGISGLSSNEEMNLAMRGVYSSGQENILVMQDGQRLNSYITNAVSPDYGISLAKVKQIEVLRGPASSLYGSVALTAVINIVTKDGVDIRNGAVSVGAGDRGQLAADLLLGKHDMNMDFMAWFSLYRATGEPVFVPAGKQYALYPRDGFIYLDGYSELPALDGGIKLQRGNLLFSFSMNYAKKRQPYSMWLFASPYSYKKFRTFDGAGPGYSRWSAREQAVYSRTWQNVSFSTTFYTDWNKNVRYEPAGDTLQDYPIYLNPNDSTKLIFPDRGVFQYIRWMDFNVGFNTRVSYTYDWGRYGKGNMLGGVEWNRYALYDSEYLEGMNFREIVRTWTDKRLYTGHEMNANVFLQFKHNLHKNWIVNAGIRYDYKKRRNNRIMQAFSPRVSLIYLRDGLNLKASYSRSFVDAPYYYRNNDMDTYSGGENLQAEYLSSYQLTCAYHYRPFHIDVECNLFYNRASHFLFTQPETRIYENAGLLDMGGIEVTTRYRANRLNLDANLCYQRVLGYTNFFVTDGSVNNVPDFSINLVAGYFLVKKKIWNWSAHVKMNCNSRCYTQVSVLENGLNGDATNYTVRLPGYTVFSFTTRCRYKQIEGSLGVENLFNNRYECGGANIPIRQKGRWISGSILYNF